jgi:hypothetical protein
VWRSLFFLEVLASIKTSATTAKRVFIDGYFEPTNEWYAIAKITGVKACQAIRNQFNKDYVSLMPLIFMVPMIIWFNSSHVLPAMMRKFHEAKENECSGNPGEAEHPWEILWTIWLRRGFCIRKHATDYINVGQEKIWPSNNCWNHPKNNRTPRRNHLG